MVSSVESRRRRRSAAMKLMPARVVTLEPTCSLMRSGQPWRSHGFYMNATGTLISSASSQRHPGHRHLQRSKSGGRNPFPLVLRVGEVALLRPAHLNTVNDAVEADHTAPIFVMSRVPASHLRVVLRRGTIIDPPPRIGLDVRSIFGRLVDRPLLCIAKSRFQPLYERNGFRTGGTAASISRFG
jgi:hypothetical protein